MTYHGFLGNRNGRDIPVFEIPPMLEHVYSVQTGYGGVNLIINLGQTHLDPDGETHLLDIGRLWDRIPGNPGSIERDSSIIFHDPFFGEETREEIDEYLLEGLFSTSDDEYLTLEQLRKYTLARLEDSVKNNPEFNACNIGTLAGHYMPYLLLDRDFIFYKVSKFNFENFWRNGKLPDDYSPSTPQPVYSNRREPWSQWRAKDFEYIRQLLEEHNMSCQQDHFWSALKGSSKVKDE
mmetsp:Transcript_32060/g.46706  ORF Transcript_32060/g.46706 Transcript_32060/m.46706 type:complete len:236 (+) Transcript_32060:211-918(+)